MKGDSAFNNIFNDDCCNVMEKLNDNSIDMAIVDPPYFRILKEDWDKFRNKDEYLSWSEKYLKLCVSKLRLSGTIAMYGCSRNFSTLCSLSRILEENGMYFVEEIVLDKGIKSVAGRISSKIKMLPPVSENILIFRKDAKPFVKELLIRKQKEFGITTRQIKLQLGIPLNGGANWTKYCGDTEFPLLPTKEHWNELSALFKIDIPYSDISETYNGVFGLTNVWNDIDFYIKNRQHPSEKPVALEERVIRIFTNSGNSVLIPFLGSGNAVIACINTNRKFIGCDTNEMYYNLAKSRINQHIIDSNMQDTYTLIA